MLNYEPFLLRSKGGDFLVFPSLIFMHSSLTETGRTQFCRDVGMDSQDIRFSQVLDKDGNPGHWFNMKIGDCFQKSIHVNCPGAGEKAELIMSALVQQVQNLRVLLEQWDSLHLCVALRGFSSDGKFSGQVVHQSGQPEAVLNLSAIGDISCDPSAYSSQIQQIVSAVQEVLRQ